MLPIERSGALDPYGGIRVVNVDVASDSSILVVTIQMYVFERILVEVEIVDVAYGIER